MKPEDIESYNSGILRSRKRLLHKMVTELTNEYALINEELRKRGELDDKRSVIHERMVREFAIAQVMNGTLPPIGGKK